MKPIEAGFAKKLLVHYFTLAMEHQGLRVDMDNISEIEQIVDDLLISINHELAEFDRRISVLEEGEY